MKFLTEKKKLFSLIAMICLAVNMVCIVIYTGAVTLGTSGGLFDNFKRFIFTGISLSATAIGLLVPVCYTVAAFFVWKKNDHMKILGVAGAISIISMFIAFVGNFASAIAYGYFSFGTLVGQLFSQFLPFVFAAYLIVFSLIKVKGPVVPIAGAVLIVLFCGSELWGAATLVVRNFIHMIQYFSWGIIWNTIVSVIVSGVEMIGNIGLLLLVPAAFYIPKDEEAAVGEVVANAEAEIVEEIPVAE